MAHFEYEYADCWRQALILDVIRPFRMRYISSISGALAGVNGSDCCALPFSCSQAAGRTAVAVATEPGLGTAPGSETRPRAQPAAACTAGRYVRGRPLRARPAAAPRLHVSLGGRRSHARAAGNDMTTH